MGRHAIPITLERLLANCARHPSGCLLWRGSVARGGYGKVKHRGRTYLVHRLVWGFTRGSIQPGMKVLHKCDTPACNEESHFFLGTTADNNADRKRKGRGYWDHRPDGTCRRGHVLAVVGVYRVKGGRRGPKVLCRACSLGAERRRYRSRRQA